MTNEEMVADLKQFIAVTVSQQIASQMKEIDLRFDRVEKRIDKLDKKIDDTKQELVEGMNDMVETIIGHIDDNTKGTPGWVSQLQS